MSEPLKFTSDAAWLRELSQLEVPFGSAGQPREIREKAERFDSIADKLESLQSRLGAAEKRVADLTGELDNWKSWGRNPESDEWEPGRRILELRSRLGEAEKLLAAASLAMDGRNVPVTLKRILDFLNGAVEIPRTIGETDGTR